MNPAHVGLAGGQVPGWVAACGGSLSMPSWRPEKGFLIIILITRRHFYKFHLLTRR